MDAPGGVASRDVRKLAFQHRAELIRWYRGQAQAVGVPLPDTGEDSVKNLIFICYRGSDEPFAALLLEAWLTERFGRGQVFRDSRSIPLGTEFPDRLLEALYQCRAFIAVIGHDWLGRNPGGTRRIDDPGDYVRREVATALQRNVRVVPVLVGRASLPAVGDLPTDIAGIASRQYMHLRVRTADADASRLVDELAEALGGTEPLPTRRPSTGQPGTAAYYFHGPVDARYSVLGNAHGAG